MKWNVLASMLLSVLLVSCATEQMNLAPVVNSSGEPVVLKPSRFRIHEKTRRSDVVRLAEDITIPLGEDFPSRLVKLDPDRGEAVAGALVLLPAQIKEKGRAAKQGVVVPVIGVKSVGVPQERLEAAMPAIQRAYYRQLKKHGRLIPASRVESQKENQ